MISQQAKDILDILNKNGTTRGGDLRKLYNKKNFWFFWRWVSWYKFVELMNVLISENYVEKSYHNDYVHYTSKVDLDWQ